MTADLSFKCRMYGGRDHEPCSGTTDDGREAECLCWCHDEARAEAVAQAGMFGDTGED